MSWEIEYTDEFSAWWASLESEAQDALAQVIGLLEVQGVHLGYPYSTKVISSRHEQMRELRIQFRGRPHRVLYAFDPRRVGILLLGGDKTGNDRWYEEMVPEVDKLYDEHLEILGREGLV